MNRESLTEFEFFPKAHESFLLVLGGGRVTWGAHSSSNLRWFICTVNDHDDDDEFNPC